MGERLITLTKIVDTITLVFTGIVALLDILGFQTLRIPIIRMILWILGLTCMLLGIFLIASALIAYR